MNLGEGHRSTFEPAIKNLINSFQFSFAFFWFNRQMINILPVKISYFCTCEFFKLFNRTNTNNLLAIIRNPNWYWITPISVPRKTPIFCLFQPIIKSFLLDGFWNPVSFMIIFYKICFKICNFNEPSWNCFVNQRCITSPTKWIIMNLSTTLDQSSFLFYILYNYFICIFDIQILIRGTLSCKFTILINRNRRVIWMNDWFLNTKFIIFFTESWSTMNDSSTRIISNKITCKNFKTALFFSWSKKVKHRKILFAFQIFTFEFLNNFEGFLIFTIKRF